MQLSLLFFFDFLQKKTKNIPEVVMRYSSSVYLQVFLFCYWLSNNLHRDLKVTFNRNKVASCIIAGFTSFILTTR
ncbi:MAG: hypothetical protein RSC68_21965, partial [Acinetobacter sp.]